MRNRNVCSSTGLLAATLLAATSAATAATISVPFPFTNGTVADANEVNANFSTLETESNAQAVRLTAAEANIGFNASNISANAADILSKGSDILTNQAGVSPTRSTA